MTDSTLYAVIVSGYALTDTEGWDEPRVLYAGPHQLTAESILALTRRFGESLNSLGGKWLPISGEDPSARYFIVPSEAFLITASNHTQDTWAAIVTEEKNFSLPRDRQTMFNNGQASNATPTDFRQCAGLRFYAVTADHLEAILQAHRCGTPQSDHKVVYFLPDEQTIRS